MGAATNGKLAFAMVVQRDKIRYTHTPTMEVPFSHAGANISIGMFNLVRQTSLNNYYGNVTECY